MLPSPHFPVYDICLLACNLQVAFVLQAGITLEGWIGQRITEVEKKDSLGNLFFTLWYDLTFMLWQDLPTLNTQGNTANPSAAPHVILGTLITYTNIIKLMDSSG